jgi:hypothetical protein
MPGSCQAHDYFAKGTITMPDVCRIFAGVSGSPGSVHALRQAADLARRNDAILIPLHTWMPPEGDLHERRHPARSCASYGKRTPGSGCGRPSTPPLAACPPGCEPSPWCCAASPARY